MLNLSASVLQTPAYRVRFLRSEPNDAGFADRVVTSMPTEEMLTAALLARFREPKRRVKPPTMAEVHDQSGKLVMQARVISPERAELVNLTGPMAHLRS